MSDDDLISLSATMQSSQPFTTQSVEPAPLVSHRHASQHGNRRHIVWEFVLGLIGVYGVGFLLSGKIRPGLSRLAFSTMWAITRIVLLIATAGFAIVCLLPATVLLAIVNAATLHRLLRSSPSAT